MAHRVRSAAGTVAVLAARRISHRALRRRIHAGLSHTGGVVDAGVARASDLADVGRSRVGDAVQSVGPVIMRVVNDTEVQDTLRQALNVGADTASPIRRRGRWHRRAITTGIAAVVAVAIAVVVLLVARRRRRAANAPEAAPE